MRARVVDRSDRVAGLDLARRTRGSSRSADPRGSTGGTSTSRPSLPASSRHISSTSASVVLPYTSGLRVPSRLRLGPLRTSTDVMALSATRVGWDSMRPGRRGRPGRSEPVDRRVRPRPVCGRTPPRGPGVASLWPRSFMWIRNVSRAVNAAMDAMMASPKVMLPTVQTTLPRSRRPLPGRSRRTGARRRPRTSCRRRTHRRRADQRRVDRRQEGGDQGADVLRDGERGDAGLGREQLLVERREHRVVALVDDAPHQDGEEERHRQVALGDEVQVRVGQDAGAERADDEHRPAPDPVGQVADERDQDHRDDVAGHRDPQVVRRRQADPVAGGGGERRPEDRRPQSGWRSSAPCR